MKKSCIICEGTNLRKIPTKISAFVFERIKDKMTEEDKEIVYGGGKHLFL